MSGPMTPRCFLGSTPSASRAGRRSVALLFRFVAFVPITVAGLGLMVTRYGGLRTLRTREPATAQP